MRFFFQSEGSSHITLFNVEHSTCDGVSFLIVFWLLILMPVWSDLEPSNRKPSVCDGSAHCALPRRPEPAVTLLFLLGLGIYAAN